MIEQNGNTTHKLYEQEMAFIRRDFERLEKKVDKLDSSLTSGLDALSTQLRLMSENYVHRIDAEKENRRLQEQIDKKADKEQADRLENAQRWVTRIVISAVIMAAMGALLISTPTV